MRGPEEMANGSFDAPSLKVRALRLLSQREYSRAELERKLARHEEEPGTLAQALDELSARNFISQSRVVQSVLHQKAPRLGAARVRQELQRKGIEPEAIADAVRELQATELARATEIWRRRFGEVPQDAAARAKQMRFLLTRGFSSAVAARITRTDENDAA